MRTSLIGFAISFSLLALSAQAQTPSFTAASVVNDASMVAGSIAPGERVDITGTNLGDPTFFRNCALTYPLPTACFGITVLVNGKAAPIANVSSTRLVFQAPSDLAGSTATIQVTSNLSGSTLSSAVVSVPVAPTAPGLYTVNGTGTGTGYYYVSGGLIPQYSQPVLAGSTVVLFGTGFGVTNPAVAAGDLGPNTPAGSVATATLTINNQSVPVTFSGLQPGNLSGASAGTDEVIFTVPTGLNVPLGQTEVSYPVVVTLNGVASQPVNIRVATPPPDITSIDPNPVPLSSSPQTVTINGTGFQSGVTIRLSGPGGVTILKSPDVTFVSSTKLTVQMNVGTTAGTFGATAINPDGGQSPSFVFTASGTAITSSITSIVTTSSQAPAIAQNTWLEVHGTNLAKVTTDWSLADFTHGLPTSLGGVSALVNGKSAAIYYVSPTQINLLAPLDNATGSVAVQVTTPYGQTAPKSVTENATSPAFLVIDLAGHVAAQHIGYALIGPSSLNAPGYTFTPAKPNETVILYATGFGQTTPAMTDQANETGAFQLPTLPAVSIGGAPATVSFAGMSGPGLYQFNVVVPAGTPDGDATLSATYNGSSTQSKVFLTVQH